MDAPKQAPSRLRFRQSATALSATDLANFRSGISKMIAVTDDRGYEYWAGIHGLPLPISCHHHDPYFLPWHRAYLYFMEQHLLDQEPSASLPWWDWTTQSGIPPAFTDRKAADGTVNSLLSAPITGIPRQQFTEDGVPRATRTTRRPKSPSGLPSPQQVEQVLQLNDFADFSQQLESQIHDAVHVWVGATMSMIPLAAYDPLFWAHHTMIDRLWALWQLRHNDVGPPASMLPVALVPFPMTVAQTLDITSLGYQYAQSAASATP